MSLPHSLNGDHPFTVTRIWPRPHGRLSLELRRGEELAAGQVVADIGERERIRAATARRARHPDDVQLHPATATDGEPTVPVLVQLHGADRRLTALPSLLADPGATLLVHRPERRAVLVQGDEVVRVVRPGRSEDLVRAAHDAEQILSGIDGVRVPVVLLHDADQGVVRTERLVGGTLRAHGAAPPLSATGVVASDGVATAAGRAVGLLLRHLGTQRPPEHLPVRDAEAEVRWIGVWHERVAQFRPDLAAQIDSAFERAAPALADAPTQPTAVVHGDLHDGQILLTAGSHAVGVLDWDTLAAGEAALDAGCWWAHLELRQMSGEWRETFADAVSGAVLDSWRPDQQVWARMWAYRGLILVRMACQYAFRPGHDHLVEPLLDAARQRAW